MHIGVEVIDCVVTFDPIPTIGNINYIILEDDFWDIPGPAITFSPPECTWFNLDLKFYELETFEEVTSYIDYQPVNNTIRVFETDVVTYSNRTIELFYRAVMDDYVTSDFYGPYPEVIYADETTSGMSFFEISFEDPCK